MAHKRLLNCEFINASAFKNTLSNKAKLLYLYMFSNADDRGFCDTTEGIIESLGETEEYSKALTELLNRGLLIKFENKYGNKIYLIRHWYCHNQYREKLYTTYYKYLKLVHLEDNEYHIGEKETHIKENKINETNINDIKLNEIKGEETEQEEQTELNELEAEMPF